MKRALIIFMILAIVSINVTIAIAGNENTEKMAASLAYFKAGIFWDVNGLTYNTTNDKNIRDLHVDGNFPYISDILGLEDVNYNKKFSFGFLNLTMVFLVSREPIQ